MKLDEFIDKEYQVDFQLMKSLFIHQGKASKRQLFKEINTLSTKNLQIKLDALNNSTLLQTLQLKITVADDVIILNIPNGLTFNYIISYFVHESFSFRLINYSLLQSAPVTTSNILYFFNLSKASYYRYLKKTNSLLSQFDLTIKNGVLIGTYIQKLAFLFELNWSTQASHIYSENTTIPDYYLKEILNIMQESPTIFNIAKLSVFIRTLLSVDQHSYLDKKAIQTLDSKIFANFSSYLKQLHDVIKNCITDQNFYITKILLIFVMCLICQNDSNVVKLWTKVNKQASTSIYNATTDIFLKINSNSLYDPHNYFNQLLLLHTLFRFKVNGLNINSSPKGEDIVDNWFGLNVIKKMTHVTQAILDNPKYSIIFNPKSKNSLLRYYSILFIVNLENQQERLTIGVYSGRSELLSRFLLTYINQFKPVIVNAEIIDPYHLESKYDLIISDIATYLPNLIKTNTYQIAYYNSQLDYENINKKINELILTKFL